MPPKRKSGRPKTAIKHGDATASALQQILDDDEATKLESPGAHGINPILRTLLVEADRRGLTLAQLCHLTGRDASALRRSIHAPSPHLKTIEDLAAALNFAPVVVRALTNTLTARDLEDHLRHVVVELCVRQNRFFTSPPDLSAALHLIWYREPNVRRDLVEAFVLAKNGLATEAEPLLGPIVGAIEVALRKHRLSLFGYLASPAEIVDRLGAANSWFSLLHWNLGLSERDTKSIIQIMRPYALDRKRPSPEELRARQAAEEAAEKAYYATYEAKRSANGGSNLKLYARDLKKQVGSFAQRMMSLVLR